MIAFEEEFKKTKGMPFEHNGITYRMFYDLELGENTEIKVRVIKFISSPRQGIRFDSAMPMSINGKQSNAFSIWLDSAPHDFTIACSPNSKVTIRNIWDNGDGVEQSWHAGGAMTVAKIENGVICKANSTKHKDSCDDLEIFLELKQ